MQVVQSVKRALTIPISNEAGCDHDRIIVAKRLRQFGQVAPVRLQRKLYPAQVQAENPADGPIPESEIESSVA